METPHKNTLVPPENPVETKLYIAVRDDFPDHMVPTLVAHTVLAADLQFTGDPIYDKWKTLSFKKCVVKVNEKEFDKIKNLGSVFLGYEVKTRDGRFSCAVVRPYANKEDIPNVLKFAKLWRPSCE